MKIFNAFLSEMMIVLPGWEFEMIGKRGELVSRFTNHELGGTVWIVLHPSGEKLLCRCEDSEDFMDIPIERDPRKSGLRLLNCLLNPYLERKWMTERHLAVM